MGFYEENVLYKDRFYNTITDMKQMENKDALSKAITDMKRMEKPKKQVYTSSVGPKGMFESDKDCDIFNGKNAAGFFQLMENDDQLDRFLQKAELFHHQSLSENEE